MYEPNVTLTTDLQDSLREVEEVRYLLDTIPILPIVEDRIQREALVETVHYTTRIEGNPLDIRDVERLADPHAKRPEINRDRREVLNLYKVMDFIRDIESKKDIPIDEKVIRQIHAFVVRDIPEQGTPGEYRLKQNAIQDQTTGEQVFLPPPPAEVGPLMAELGSWLSRVPLGFHPVITAAIAHLELVAIHPFDNGNGRTSRALADLILCRHGFALRHLFSWVAQMGIDMAKYHQTLRHVLGPKYGANADPIMWIEYFARSVATRLQSKKAGWEDLREKFVDAYNAAAKAGLSRDQVEAFIYAGVYGSVTTRVYMRATGYSRSTAVKRLCRLVEIGFLQTDGSGRNSCYVLSNTALTLQERRVSEGEQLPLDSPVGHPTRRGT